MRTHWGVLVLGAAVWVAVGSGYIFGSHTPWGQSLPVAASVGVDSLAASLYVGIVVYGIFTLVHRPPADWGGVELASFAVIGLIDFIGLFAFIYLNIDQLVPHSFGAVPLTNLDAVYVATTTLTSLGSGSVEPTSEASRAIVTVESGVSLALVVGALGLLISRFVVRTANSNASQR